MTLILFLKSKENIIMLFILLVSTLLISLFLLSPLNITSGNWNSTQTHFSSVGVEALAGVLAIVISVTLMAVQFSSQEYSQKIMGSYIRSFFFWSLIVIYILTIIFNILILNRIPQNITNNTINTKMVDLSIMLTILCFVLLIPYFLFTVMQLRPEHIIKKILMSVDKKFAKSNQGKNSSLDLEDLDSDPVLPVIDIIEKAMKSYDRSTIRLGLEKMYERYDLITKENDQFISEYFKKHFLKLSESAMLNSNIYTIKRIVDIFVKMAGQHNAKEKTYATNHATDAFYQIADNALKHKLTEVVIYTVDKFVEVVRGFKKSEKDKIIAYEDIAPRLSGLGHILSEQKELEVATMRVLEGLRKLEDIFGLQELGSSAIKTSQTNAAMKAVKMLVDLATNTESEDDMKMAINTANDLILEATDHGQKVQFASKLLGEYMGKEISKGKTNIKDLENESYCKFEVLEEGVNKVILEMKSCYIKTIKEFDDEKIQSYCKKTSATNEQGCEDCEELPVCTITYSYLTSVIKQIKSYMFSWENVPGNDSERLIRFLVDELGIELAENAKTYKSNDDDIINIANDDYSAEIIMDKNKKKAILKVSKDRTLDLLVETEKSKLNIYKQRNVKLNKPIEWNENGCHRLTFILE